MGRMDTCPDAVNDSFCPWWTNALIILLTSSNAFVHWGMVIATDKAVEVFILHCVYRMTLQHVCPTVLPWIHWYLNYDHVCQDRRIPKCMNDELTTEYLKRNIEVRKKMGHHRVCCLTKSYPVKITTENEKLFDLILLYIRQKQYFYGSVVYRLKLNSVYWTGITYWDLSGVMSTGNQRKNRWRIDERQTSK